MTSPIFRASAASKWVPCNEAAWLEQLYPEPENEQSREGTAAHEMSELTLCNVVSTPDELVNRQASNGVIFSGEMVPHVEMYVDHIRSQGVGYWIEKSVSIRINDQVTVTGKTDGATFAFNETTGELGIKDFKYGHGPVEVFENWQELIYAIGIANDLIAKGFTVTSITLTIIQPRGYHHDGPIRSWTITASQLQEYLIKLRQAVEAAMSPDRKCITGPHCRYCKVLPYCNAAKAAAMNAVDVAIKHLPDTDTPESIANQLDTLKRASDMIQHSFDAMKARAQSSILNGQPVPRWDYQPGTGKSKFINNEDAISSALLIYGVDITDNSICTPAEAKRRKIPKDVVDSWSTQPSTAPKLVQSSAQSQADKEFN